MVCLVIPALNEAEVITEVVRSVPRTVVNQIIVVDNGSTDATAQAAKDAGAIVVSQPARGYGRACRAGMNAAVKAGADIVVFIDGDGSDCPEFMSELVRPRDTRNRQSQYAANFRGSLGRLVTALALWCEFHRYVSFSRDPLGAAAFVAHARGNLRLESGDADVGGAEAGPYFGNSCESS